MHLPGQEMSKPDSLLALTWLDDIFMRLHHRWMVHCETSISNKAKEFEFSGTLREFLALCDSPFVSHLVEIPKATQLFFLFFLYGLVFVWDPW